MKNKGTIAIILTLVILGIFAIDTGRRLYNDWRGAQGELEVHDGSSEVESLNDPSAEPLDTTDTGAASTTTTKASTLSSVTNGFSGEATTTTTTAVTMDAANTSIFQVPTASVHTGSLIMINKNFPLQDTPQLLKFTDFKYAHFRLPSTSLQVNAITTEPLVAWFNAFYGATSNEQVMIYATTAMPQSPNYKFDIPERASGLSLDLAILNTAATTHTPFTADGNFAWLNDHAAEYGYILRYPNDKVDITGQQGLSWHYRFVGLPHAIYMKDQNLCLEEYLNLVQQHPWTGEHLTYTAAGQNYEVYYVPASESTAMTDIPHPTGIDPQVSGDNMKGFVVTIAKPNA